MSPRAEELAGKLLLTAAFGALAIRNLGGIAAMLAMPERAGTWAVGLLIQGLTLVFVALIVVMTLRRAPASRNARGIEPRLSAIGGTFLLLALAWLPPGGAPPAALLVATALILIGTLLSIYCLHFLGTSFSVLASARALVTRGPYAIVRHPLYAVEALTVAGIVTAHWSIPALALGIAQVVLQFRRMAVEERVLREAFPGYAAYAARVPMLVPRTATAAG